MAGYPGTDGEQRIPHGPLTTLVCAIFERTGMSSAHARLLSETLVVADLRGCHSHGILRVPEYVKKLSEGGVDPKGAPRVVQDRNAAIVVDGGNSMGQIAASFAMQKAIERAHDSQVTVAAVRGSNHCGAMAYFAMQALAANMIGIATTNALPTMAPWGAVDKILGINPLAVAMPAGREHPLVFDAAFSASSHGKIRVYHQKGLPLPEGWAFDQEGRPTTDTDSAISGLLQPIGAYKGTGLALIMGVLSTLLSGASYGTELGDMVNGPKAGHDGHFLMALNIEAFEDTARFKERMDGIIRQIRESRRGAGTDDIYAPGGLEAETEQRYRREGVPLNSLTLEGLKRVAEQSGVDPAPLQPAAVSRR